MSGPQNEEEARGVRSSSLIRKVGAVMGVEEAFVLGPRDNADDEARAEECLLPSGRGEDRPDKALLKSLWGAGVGRSSREAGRWDRDTDGRETDAGNEREREISPLSESSSSDAGYGIFDALWWIRESSEWRQE